MLLGVFLFSRWRSGQVSVLWAELIFLTWHESSHYGCDLSTCRFNWSKSVHTVVARLTQICIYLCVLLPPTHHTVCLLVSCLKPTACSLKYKSVFPQSQPLIDTPRGFLEPPVTHLHAHSPQEPSWTLDPHLKSQVRPQLANLHCCCNSQAHPLSPRSLSLCRWYLCWSVEARIHSVSHNPTPAFSLNIKSINMLYCSPILLQQSLGGIEAKCKEKTDGSVILTALWENQESGWYRLDESTTKTHR